MLRPPGDAGIDEHVGSVLGAKSEGEHAPKRADLSRGQACAVGGFEPTAEPRGLSAEEVVEDLDGRRLLIERRASPLEDVVIGHARITHAARRLVKLRGVANVLSDIALEARTRSERALAFVGRPRALWIWPSLSTGSGIDAHVTGSGVIRSRMSASACRGSIANAVTGTNSANDRSWRRVAATIQALMTAPAALQVSCR